MEKAKKSFYNRLLKISGPEICSELAVLIQNDVDCGFFELCQSFVHIGVNASKIKNSDGTVTGVFQEDDIKTAIQKTISFIKNNEIKQLDEFLLSLGKYYPLAVDNSENNPYSTIIFSDFKDSMLYGRFHAFNRMPTKIFEDIVVEIKNIIH